MAAPTFIFEVDPNGDRLRFGCEQRTVTPVKPEGAGAAEYSLAAFVSDDPEGIMFSSWPPGRVRAADRDRVGARGDEARGLRLRTRFQLSGEAPGGAPLRIILAPQLGTAVIDGLITQ